MESVVLERVLTGKGGFALLKKKLANHHAIVMVNFVVQPVKQQAER